MQIVEKTHARNVGGLAVVADASKVVRAGAAAGEMDFVTLCAAGAAEARRAGMWRQLAPFNLIRVFVINLADPAFVRGQVRRARAGVFLGTVDHNNFLVRQTARVAEHGRSRKWRAFAPDIFFRIVDLDVVHRPILRAATNQINEAIMVHSNHAAIDGQRNIGAAIPLVIVGHVSTHVGNGELRALPVHNISAKEKNLAPRADR